MDMRMQRNLAVGVALTALSGTCMFGLYTAALSSTVVALQKTCDNDKKDIKTKFDGQKSALEGTARAVTNKLRESEAKAAGFQGTLTTALQRTNTIYNQVADATVQIMDHALAGHCHGVLASFKGEVVILTAGHCVVDQAGKKTGGEFRLSYYYNDPQPDWRSAYYVGYGYLEKNRADGVFDKNHVVLGSGQDIAYVRGLPQFKQKEIAERAIPIAEATPSPLRLVYSTHWQEHCWQTDPFNGPCEHGELLIPNLGISRKIGVPNTFYDYLLAAYPGDSGSPICNDQGQIIGIVSGTHPDKVEEEISTTACGPRSIRMFLENTWKK